MKAPQNLQKKKINRSFSESLGMQSILAVDDFYSRKLGTDIEFESDFPKLSKEYSDYS